MLEVSNWSMNSSIFFIILILVTLHFHIHVHVGLHIDVNIMSVLTSMAYSMSIQRVTKILKSWQYNFLLVYGRITIIVTGHFLKLKKSYTWKLEFVLKILHDSKKFAKHKKFTRIHYQYFSAAYKQNMKITFNFD